MSDTIQFGVRIAYDGAPMASGVKANTDQVKAFGDTARRAGAEAAASLDRTAVSAKQTAAALRGVPAQFTDIVTSIAAGQNPMQVMLQQGGQLKDMFGGVGPAARALGGYVAGMINPFTLTAAAVGGLTLAWYQGSKESDAYTRNLILTGNAVGKTASQLEEAARRAASATGGTQGAAAEALALAVGTAVIPAEALDAVAAAAVRMQRATGAAIEDTVAQFEKLAQNPVAASLKLNEQFRYLTAETYRQIKAFEDQGRSADAAALAIKAYADAIADRSGKIKQNLGTLESAWSAVKGAAKGAWDAMLNLGRDNTAGEKIAAQEKLVAGLRANVAALEKSATTPEASLRQRQQLLAAEEAKLTTMKAATAATEQSATADAARNKTEQAGINLAREADKFATRQVQMKRELAHVEGLYAASAKTAADAEARRAAIAGIREKFAQKKVDNGLDDSAREQAKAYAQQYEAAAKLARGIEAEAAAGEKLLPVERALAEARGTLSEAQVREIEIALAGALLIERRTQAEKEATAASKIYGDAVKAQIGPIEERARALATERDNADKTEAEINRLAIARLEEAMAIAASNGARQEHLDFYAREIEARRELARELAAQKEAQADWAAGAARGLRDYGRESEKSADRMASTFKRGAQMAEDAIANFVVKGKVDIRSLAEYAAIEMARENLAKPFIKTGSAWLGGLFNSDATAEWNYGPAQPDLSPVSFAGGGHTGNGPRSGGLDGQGGFMAMLHPQETVTDHTLGGGSAAAQNIRVEVVNPPGRAAEVASATPRIDIDGTVLRIVMREMEPGGRIARQQERQYGLNAAAGVVR